MRPDAQPAFGTRRNELIVLLLACLVFIGCIVSPPSLMDDVDATQANIARSMLTSGDWITPHLDGVKYFEKPPLKYWLIAIFFRLFGIHDYIARLPLALLDVVLCLTVYRFGRWAFGELAGLYAGLAITSCIGLFLFTRILIPDSQLTLVILLGVWGLLRALDPEEPHPARWAITFWVSLALAVLLKGLIGVLFPLGAGGIFLIVTGQLLQRDTWTRLSPARGIALTLLIALPWHIMAMLRNPPYFRFDLQSGPGNYRGWFWAYFFNEHLLRFLNRRFPHDYNTVPRPLFWLLNLLWLFPWSVYLPGLFRLRYRGSDRASRTRLLCLCLAGFVMVFFTFSSTQEYYSMPIYPAVALLIGCALANSDENAIWRRWGTRILIAVCASALVAILFILSQVWSLPTLADISAALRSESTSNYTLSLGHMGDLTLQSFAYLRPPLVLAGVAFALGICGLLVLRGARRLLAAAAMMLLFLHAARLAMVTFDPYLSSRSLAEALRAAPPGKLIVSDQYYSFSSVFFYANTAAYLLNGRVQNLEYGSNAPRAPHVFIDDRDLARMWASKTELYYLLAEHEFMPAIQSVIGPGNYVVEKESGGKFLLSNRNR